eukprot:TRINITY_DN1493_c0_g4_i1.p1 TRINITY_DN1493_c0_g4~~TRINITY_DN1493_c0_g4_i1.p1  ORF type:complete len:624 (+),score=148.42 TRINITY_DN1493_c0_g4_i1:334-2205(+)
MFTSFAFMTSMKPPKYLFLVLEHVEGGELFDYLVSKGSLDVAEARIFFQQIIAGMDYCHNHLICHRDLKPENLLLDAEKNIKICDFGMAALMKKNELLSTSCGSPHYASPEVVMGIKYDGFAADVWSCGVILFALLTGKLPFDDENIRTLLAKVKTGHFTMPPTLSAEAQDLISKMLTLDPKKRITIKEIRSHPWFLANRLVVPVTPPIIEVNIPDKVLEVDDEIIRSLVCLGWPQEDQLLNALSSSGGNIEKAFYWLLDERKNHPSFNPVEGTVNVTPGQHPGRRLSSADTTQNNVIQDQNALKNNPNTPPNNNNSSNNNGQPNTTNANDQGGRVRSNSSLSVSHQNPAMRRVTSTGNKAVLTGESGGSSDNKRPQSPRGKKGTPATTAPPSTFLHIKLDTNEEAQRSWFSSFLGGSRRHTPSTASSNSNSLFSSSSSISAGTVGMRRDSSDGSGVPNMSGSSNSMSNSNGNSSSNSELTKLGRDVSSNTPAGDGANAPKKDENKKLSSRAKALIKDNFYSTKAVTGGAFGLHSRKPPDQVISELKRTLTALNVTYRYIKKGNCIKAKCLEGSNKVKFVIEVTLLQEGNDVVSSFISFVRTHGDLPTYRVVCKKIEDEIVLK